MNSTNCSKTQRRQRGLTLIELVVVLAILVALAGLIIGNFPSLFRKATRAVGANSIQDIARAVQFQATVRNNFGSGYDNLVNSGGTLYTYLAQGALSTQLAPVTIVAADGDDTALTSLGLTEVYSPIVGVTDNITWDAYGQTAVSTPIAGGLVVSGVTTNVAHPLFNNAYGSFDKYIILGVGSRCTLVGADRSLLEAPTRSSATPGNDPKTSYQRYGVVFGLRGAAASRQAVFMGAVGLDGTGLARTDSEIKDYNAN